MFIPPVTIDDLARAIQVANDAAATCDRADPTDRPFDAAVIAIYRHFGHDKGRAVNWRLLLAHDLAKKPMLKRAWTRVNNGQDEIAAALLYAAAVIPYTSYNISSREIHRLAKHYEESDD